MTDLNSKRFVEKNLPNFRIGGKGWHALIRDMLLEFLEAGWNINTPVYGKEKFGELRCHMIAEDETVNKRIHGIVSKYTSISLKTCETCGNSGSHRSINGWESTLCREHYFEEVPIISIDGNRIRLGKKTFHLRQFHQAEFQRGFEIVHFYNQLPFQKKTFICSFSWQHPNYYALLKQVPTSVFTTEQKQAVSAFFDNLSGCDVCGHVAVYKDYCRRCYHSIWDESDLDCYADKNEYIKERQMDNEIDSDDHMALFKNDISFEKVPDHKILFTQEELELYIKECEDDDF
jgi:hypothetical protein